MRPLILITLVTLLLSSCAVSKQKGWLAEHQRQLTKAATDTRMSKEQKLDILGTSLADMMHQSLDFLNPKKGISFAQSYANANNDNIAKIVDDLSPWINNLNTIESIALGAQLIKKPYTKDLIDLVPRFRRKYKQYQAVSRLLGKVGDLGETLPGGIKL